MKIYSNCADAITDLHKNGFTNYFQLFGNDLLCIQEGFFIPAADFAISECYKIPSPGRDGADEIIAFAIVAPYHNIKGILFNDYNNYSSRTPPILIKKLNELNFSG